jgi:hypothetical protein
MYGRADGMPSFQLTVAVCTENIFLLCHCALSIWFWKNVARTHSQASGAGTTSEKAVVMNRVEIDTRWEAESLVQPRICLGRFYLSRSPLSNV